MKKILVLSAFVLLFQLQAQNIQSDLGPDWKEIGKISPRHAKEIKTSNLWVGGETLDRDYANYEEYKKYLGPLGAKKLRLQSGWAKTEKEKGVYNFEWIDAIVNDVISQGVQPWIQISYGNTIYGGAGTVDLGGGIPHGEEGLAAWERYTRALITHFKDRVFEWEVWNEPDLGENRKHPEIYAELFYRTAKIIREVQPNSTIVALAITSPNIEYTTVFLDYLKDRNALSYIDVITFHGYPMIPESTIEGINKYRNFVWTYKPDIKFWQGETGCPSTKGSSGALSKHPWTELTQSKWNLRRALVHIGNDIPFSMFLLCEFSYLNHPGYVNRDKLNTKGLLKINEKTQVVEYAKPAYYAYQNLCAILTGDIVTQKDIKYSTNGKDLSVFAFKNEKKNSYAIAVWYDGEIPSDDNIYRTTTISVDKVLKKKLVYIDIRTGKIYQIPKQNIKNENGKISISVPVYDSPCIITNLSFLK